MSLSDYFKTLVVMSCAYALIRNEEALKAVCIWEIL
jgi:hypothetical protein